MKKSNTVLPFYNDRAIGYFVICILLLLQFMLPVTVSSAESVGLIEAGESSTVTILDDQNTLTVTDEVYETETGLNTPEWNALVQPAPKREFRGAWISSVYNLDWPQSNASAEQQKRDLIAILDELEALNINAIMLQIKPAADALYPSTLAPWSAWLTGVQGKDPGYDPLGFALEETKKRNMELHAWFNPYRASVHQDLQRLAEDHVVKQHPDWIVPYGNGLYLNPGLPEVQQYILATILEVVEQYDIAGVHFDDHFYPYPVQGAEFDDAATYAQYGSGFSSKADWRRDNVNTLIEQISNQTKAKKPHVQFGISPFGIWRNASTDPTGSPTQGFESYDGAYADSRKWIQEQWIDYIIPQLYWSFEHASAPYDKLVDWWANEVQGKNVHLYIGHSIYKVGTDDAGWLDEDQIARQIQYARNENAVQGSALYSINRLLTNPLGIQHKLQSEVFQTLAIAPAMPWLAGGSPPAAPQQVQAVSMSAGIELNWISDAADADTQYYVIYRGTDTTAPDPMNSSSIVGIQSRQPGVVQRYVDVTASSEQVSYMITALDHRHVESLPSAWTQVSSQPIAQLPGDANGDGVITLGDVAILLKLLGMGDEDEQWLQVQHLDLDANGQLDMNDVRLLSKLVLNP